MRVISVAIIVFAAGVAAGALAPNLTSLVALRLFTGGVAAAIIPLALATIGNLTPYAGRQAAIAALLAATASGQVLSAAIGGVLAEVLSWRAIFLVDGLLAVLLIVPLWRYRRATPPLAMTNQHPFAEHLALARDPRALALYGAVMIEGALMNGGATYLGALLRERDGLSYVLIGLILSLFGVASLLTSRWLGRLSRHLGENRLILGGGLLMGSGYLLALLAPDWRGLPPAVLLMGTGFSLCHSTFQTRATELRPGARGTAISLFALALFLGGGVGTALLAALLTAAGYGAMLLVCGLGLMLLGLAAPRLTMPRTS
jgi:predicted MFS family arabinose efflux permease